MFTKTDKEYSAQMSTLLIIPQRGTDYDKHTSLYMTPKTAICYTN